MSGSYSLTLVFASYCVAVIAAYTAIYFGTRIFTMHDGAGRKFWLGMGAICMGSGIWSMHFVGMSAYTMPAGMTMSFSAPLTLLSWIPAVLASALALYVITRATVSSLSIAASAVIMGAGICAMHYGGMYAMRMDPQIQYDGVIVAISIIIAVVASGAALVICRQVRVVPAQYALVVKIVAALVMGAAICGMHYTGMAAASYPMHAMAAHDNTLQGQWMGIPTAIVASIVLLLALVVAYRDFKQAEQERRNAAHEHHRVIENAFADQSTGLANRTRFEQLLIQKMSVEGNRFSLVYIEMNGYRDLRSALGEQSAQQMAQDFAVAIKKELGNTDDIARYNSAGFIALVPEMTNRKLASVFAQLKYALGGADYMSSYGQWSLGYSNYPDSATNSRLLVRAAQKTRYNVDYQAASA
ncbi:MHYT domain-containing protein [Gilvimarinus polysaccharolyticus]|uniref:MHYT domain-containing protein n=1 Tax=Gilvimarinus polysaccharolyticus TaxID=863921 RepID=UPI000673306B|nr:MHYT domain-containing protein [Gilvimarinus polysaccharolyticus]